MSKASYAKNAKANKPVKTIRYSIIQNGKIVPFTGTAEELARLNPESIIKHVPLRKPSAKAPMLNPKVTQHILDSADPNSTKNCALIMATKQNLIEKGYDSWGWEVRDGVISFNVNHPGIGNNYTKFLWVLPPEVFDKTAEFDDKERRPFMKPFDFKLDARAATWKPGRKQALRTKKNKPRDPSKPYGTKTPSKPGVCRTRRHLGRSVPVSKNEVVRVDGALGPRIMGMNAPKAS